MMRWLTTAGWIASSVKHRIDEQREAQKMRAEALRMETEKPLQR